MSRQASSRQRWQDSEPWGSPKAGRGNPGGRGLPIPPDPTGGLGGPPPTLQALFPPDAWWDHVALPRVRPSSRKDQRGPPGKRQAGGGTPVPEGPSGALAVRLAHLRLSSATSSPLSDHRRHKLHWNFEAMPSSPAALPSFPGNQELHREVFTASAPGVISSQETTFFAHLQEVTPHPFKFYHEISTIRLHLQIDF
uniref:Uncharacterized protein n=1 Tax=Mustela putorius furo TaxID=9669 RepID=M3YSN7_MUSPF